MPEGDSAYRVAANLDRALRGGVVTRLEIRTGEADTLPLVGQEVRGVEAFGKHVMIRVGDYSIHSHMLMDGFWHIYRPGARWRRPGHEARVVVATEKAEAVGFLVAQVKLIRTRDEERLTGHLGPDPLKVGWDQGGKERAATNLAGDPRPLHVALLDQRNVAGFGNEYVNEICFLLGIHPGTPASLTDTVRVLDLGTRLIRANRDRVRRTTTGNTRAGKQKHVYGRAGKPCTRCGSLIRRTGLGAAAGQERVVYYCPTCQPPRRPERRAQTP